MAYIGPKKTPRDFGFKAGDYHIVVNDGTETAKAFDIVGRLLWEVPALARGQYSDFEYKLPLSDTPPGLYKIGAIYRDYMENRNPAYNRTAMAYGWFSFDLEELENQEGRYGRSGIMIHGGGSAAGWPGAWAPMQPLYPTHGCVRMHNIDLTRVEALCKPTNTVFVSVYQEA